MAQDSIIYFVKRSNGDTKIGTTCRLTPRLAQLKLEHGPITLLGIIKGGRVKEKILHWCLSDFRLDGEWFKSDNKIDGIISDYAHLPPPKVKPQIKARKRKRNSGPISERRVFVTFTETRAKEKKQIAKDQNISASRYIVDQLIILDKIEASPIGQAIIKEVS